MTCCVTIWATRPRSPSLVLLLRQCILYSMYPLFLCIKIVFLFIKMNSSCDSRIMTFPCNAMEIHSYNHRFKLHQDKLAMSVFCQSLIRMLILQPRSKSNLTSQCLHNVPSPFGSDLLVT